jgi:hypothetical protein
VKRSKVTTAPASEPVTLTELKASLRITTTAEDTLLTQYIEDARIMVERMTGRKLITQTITEYHDGLCGRHEEFESGYQMRSIGSLVQGGQFAPLDFAPVQSITTVHTVDLGNAETLYDSANYYLNNYDDDMKPSVELNSGSTITTALRADNNIKIVYVAGYGDDGADVPSALRRAILVLAGMLYANRGDCGDQCQTDCGAKAMIYPYIIKTI